MDYAHIGSLLEYLYLLVAVAIIAGAYSYAQTNTALKHMMVSWLSGGIALNLFALSMLYTTYPLIWLPSDHQLLLIAALHIVESLVAGLPFALVGIVHYYLNQRHITRSWYPLFLGIAVGGSEILRSFLLSVLFYAPHHNTIDLHYSAGTFGNGLSVTPLIEFAYGGGVYTLSSILAMLVIACFIKNVRIACVYISITTIAWCCIHFVAPIHGPQRPVAVDVIALTSSTPNKDTESLAEFKEQARLISSLIATTTAELLILPEDARFLSSLSQQEKNKLKQSTLKTIVDGESIIFRERLSNFSYIYSVQEDLLIGRGKWFLFPFSEFIPSVFRPFIREGLSSTAFDVYTDTRSYGPGKPPQVFATPFGSLGTLICSEMFSFSAIEHLKKAQPDVVVLQSHLSVFHKHIWYEMQYRSMTKIIAAEMRTPLIVSSYDAPSMIINPYGHVVTTSGYENTVLRATIK